jgi:hypothetical protein
LRNYRKKRIGKNSKCPGLQNPVTGQIFSAFIGQHAENHRSPETVTGKLIGISIVVGILMVQAMAIDPGDRIYIEREDVIDDGDGFYEPFLVVERAMSDSQMKDIGQIQSTKKPAKDEIHSADQQSIPGSPTSRGGYHTSQDVEQNNQVAREIVGFQDSPRDVIQAEYDASFKQQVKQINITFYFCALSRECPRQTLCSST